MFRRIAYSLLMCTDRLPERDLPTNEPGDGDIHGQVKMLQSNPGQFIRVFYFLTAQPVQLLQSLPQL
ncbi:MAG TPA: hypothetical protein VMP11_15090 [Verrucomicrobiae bacterium]|nr:hypothetical protein [Verrucomicrobiae bacterium]